MVAKKPSGKRYTKELRYEVGTTPQEEGRKYEKKALSNRGMRPHPMSGAGQIKEDGSDENRLCQVKRCKKSVSLSGADIRGTFVRALRQGKDPVWLIHFSEVGLTLECKVVQED